MTADVHAPPSGSRILYPELPTPLSPADLHRWFGPSYDDRRWVPTVARTPAAQTAVLVQLGVFRALGRFLTPDVIPSAVIEYVAERVGFRVPAPGAYSPSTVYRHQRAVLSYLGVAAWNPQARRLTEATMAKMAEARTDSADLINAAVDALVGGRVLFVLKLAVSLLRRAIDRGLRKRIDGVASGFSAEGDACVHCCGPILEVAVFRGR